jgi:hypothetical protein
VRPEPCPDCGVAIALTPRALERKRARCPQCALDVRLVRQEHGDGPARTSAYLALEAPALRPAARLRVERNHARLSIELAPEERIPLATGGFVAGLAMIAAGVAGVVPMVAAAVTFVALIAVGFVLAAQERSRLQILVEPTAIEIAGVRRALPTTCADLDLDPGGDITEVELRWVRDVVDARLAGDRDALADR